MSTQEEVDEAIAAVSDSDDEDEGVEPTRSFVESTQQAVKEAIGRLDQSSSRDDARESSDRTHDD